MEARKLTPEQISDLFAFCEEQEVYYYDVQIELVDHLANTIEQKWAENPNISYETALWQIYDSFGASGFRKIRREKERALGKKYLKVRRSYMASFFKLPKIALTILATTLLSLVFIKFGMDSNITSAVLLMYFIPMALYLATFIKKENRLDIKTDRRFLLIAKLNELKTAISLFYVLPFWWVYWFRIVGKSLGQVTFNPLGLPLIEIGMSVFMVLFPITLWVSYVYLPRKIKADFIREYPQFIKV